MSIKKLKKISQELRRLIFETSLINNGHLPTSLSCADILTVLYFGGFLKIDKRSFKKIMRSTFVMSKGHGETALYSVLCLKKFIQKNLLFRKKTLAGSYLGNHVDHNVPGVEFSTGSLGHGLSLSSGMALADKNHHHYILMGDAECTEGSVWEAALFASYHNLKNLTAIIDCNGIGSIDFLNNYTSLLNNFKKKWLAFGWNVQVIDGHCFKSIADSLKKTKNSKRKPNLIIAKTIKGKGLSIMENKPMWHAKKLSSNQDIFRCREELDFKCK